jgi:GR25 family glycosyltransferase involved in LPS biosynthesis
MEREDKKFIIEQKFKDLNIDVEFFRPVKFNFIKIILEKFAHGPNSSFSLATPYEFGASLSHYQVIKTALLEGRESLFIFEDDVMFDKNFDNRLTRSFSELPQGWNMIMLYGFAYNLDGCLRVNSKWIKPKNFWSAMAYGMDRKAMEEYIKMADKFCSVADLPTKDMQETLNVYCSVPSLCIPDIKFGSDIRVNMNYATTKTVINLGYGDENYI